MKLNADQQFFFNHAGHSYNPAKETMEQGRERGARNLAAAEGIARNAGVSFVWQVDADSSEPDMHPLYECLAYDAAGKVCGSLSAVEFGPDSSPQSSDYRRVVEAEIAAEYVNGTMQPANRS